MKNKTIKFLVALALTLGIYLICNKVQANTINSISMDIYVDKSGNAQVTETWNVNATSGTEVYHPYYKLGQSEISNLTVSDKNQVYETKSYWNTSKSFMEKSYTCGLNSISDGVEICWGISSYGSNTYIVKYNISNFVSELSDAQMIYWTLIPYDFSNSIGYVNIKIYTDSYISDTTDVWGYGNYGGLCYVSNGAIYMNSDGALKTSEYMTILVKFPLKTFETASYLDHDFEYYYNMSKQGSKKYKNIIPLLMIVFYFGIFLVLPIVLIIVGKNKGTNLIKFGEAGRRIPKDAPYYRDIPCNGDILKAYFIATQYGLIKNKTDILGAITLKWLKEGKIQIQNREKNGIFKKEETVIILGEMSDKTFENTIEKDLFNMMHIASKDGILENKEFEKWCSKSYDTILGWFDDILREQRRKLVQNSLITEVERGKILKNKEYIATQELKQEAINIAGLKKYLLEYTLIKDRQAIEVELFESYLIFAQMLGIAKQVAKEFKELYPNLIEQTHFNSYDNITYIHTYTTRGVYSANSARAAAESDSSGGGGFSSGGGGGGSFGGGGGGGGFR